MKLSAIIRAIVRPPFHITDLGDCLVVSDSEIAWDASAFGLFCIPRAIPTRAKRVRIIGDLTLAWWGPDTLVHQDPSAEKGAAS